MQHRSISIDGEGEREGGAGELWYSKLIINCPRSTAPSPLGGEKEGEAWDNLCIK